MEHDSTIARGSSVPVIKFKAGKKINFMKRNKKTTEKIQPLSESSFHKRFQNFFQ